MFLKGYIIYIYAVIMLKVCPENFDSFSKQLIYILVTDKTYRRATLVESVRLTITFSIICAKMFENPLPGYSHCVPHEWYTNNYDNIV